MRPPPRVIDTDLMFEQAGGGLLRPRSAASRHAVRPRCLPAAGHHDGHGRDRTDAERHAPGRPAAPAAVTGITRGIVNDPPAAERARHALDRLVKGERLV